MRPREGLSPTSPHRGGGNADRPAAVRPGRERQQPGRHRDRRSAAGSAGAERQVVRIARRASGERLGVAGQPELGGGGLAEADRAGASSTSTSSSDESGTWPANAREPYPLGTPARSTRSLSAIGSPHKVAACEMPSSSPIRSRARSGVTVANAPSSGSSRAIRVEIVVGRALGATPSRDAADRVAPSPSTRAIRSREQPTQQPRADSGLTNSDPTWLVSYSSNEPIDQAEEG